MIQSPADTSIQLITNSQPPMLCDCNCLCFCPRGVQEGGGGSGDDRGDPPTGRGGAGGLHPHAPRAQELQDHFLRAHQRRVPAALLQELVRAPRVHGPSSGWCARPAHGDPRKLPVMDRLGACPPAAWHWGSWGGPANACANCITLRFHLKNPMLHWLISHWGGAAGSCTLLSWVTGQMAPTATTADAQVHRCKPHMASAHCCKGHRTSPWVVVGKRMA